MCIRDRCFFQSPGQELAVSLNVAVTAALRKYNEINGCLPDRIIVYRDGVGEGQLSHVSEFEVAQMKVAFQQQANYNPKFAFIVVTKRINTRFFYNNRGQFFNPPPGTVVDKEVTRKGWYDFFVVSQAVRQGTVDPLTTTSSLTPRHSNLTTSRGSPTNCVTSTTTGLVPSVSLLHASMPTNWPSWLGRASIRSPVRSWRTASTSFSDTDSYWTGAVDV